MVMYVAHRPGNDPYAVPVRYLDRFREDGWRLTPPAQPLPELETPQRLADVLEAAATQVAAAPEATPVAPRRKRGRPKGSKTRRGKGPTRVR